VIVANRAAVGIFNGATGEALSCQEKDCPDDQFVAYTSSTLRGTPAVADLNGDNRYELIIGGGNANMRSTGFLYAWTDFETDLGSPPGSLAAGSVPWGTARGSSSRTGNFEQN